MAACHVPRSFAENLLCIEHVASTDTRDATPDLVIDAAPPRVRIGAGGAPERYSTRHRALLVHLPFSSVLLERVAHVPYFSDVCSEDRIENNYFVIHALHDSSLIRSPLAHSESSTLRAAIMDAGYCIVRGRQAVWARRVFDNHRSNRTLSRTFHRLEVVLVYLGGTSMITP